MTCKEMKYVKVYVLEVHGHVSGIFKEYKRAQQAGEALIHSSQEIKSYVIQEHEVI